MPIIPQYPVGTGNSYEKTQLYPVPTGYRRITESLSTQPLLGTLRF